MMSVSNFIDQVVYYTDLVGNLSAAQYCDKGAFRVGKSVAHNGDFFLNEVTADSRHFGAVLSYTGSGCMSAVSCAEKRR